MTTWPEFPVGDWQQTGPTLHRWTQIVGKVRLALSTPLNHYWHVALYVSSRGLTTSAMPYGDDLFEVEFDFVEHRLRLIASWGQVESLALQPRSVAEFYAEVIAALDRLGVEVVVWPVPVELPDTLGFEHDHVHASYDPVAANAFWRVLVRADAVFKEFRGRYLGKSSPVHFFWGGMDLAVSRFSGRPAPPYRGPSLNVSPRVMQESYSHEVSSAGFWPGDESTPPAFYCYAVPQPQGFALASPGVDGASYSEALGEFLLPYEAVRASTSPERTLLEFLQHTYSAAADLGHWERARLERTS